MLGFEIIALAAFAHSAGWVCGWWRRSAKVLKPPKLIRSKECLCGHTINYHNGGARRCVHSPCYCVQFTVKMIQPETVDQLLARTEKLLK